MNRCYGLPNLAFDRVVDWPLHRSHRKSRLAGSPAFARPEPGSGRRTSSARLSVASSQSGSFPDILNCRSRALQSGGVHRIGGRVRDPCHRKQHAIPNPLIMKSFLVARPIAAVRFFDAAVRKPDSIVELRLSAPVAGCDRAWDLCDGHSL
jgi:hypothetical protein